MGVYTEEHYQSGRILYPLGGLYPLGRVSVSWKDSLYPERILSPLGGVLCPWEDSLYPGRTLSPLGGFLCPLGVFSVP